MIYRVFFNMWQKRPPINIFYLYRNGKMGSQKETLSIFTLECIFCKIGRFSNFHFQEKILNKWPHVAYRKKTNILLLQFAKKKKWPHVAYRKKTNILLLQFAQKKMQADVFKIMPTGRSKKWIIKKHTCILESEFSFCPIP